jgi:16S rRNA processing protein RimM
LTAPPAGQVPAGRVGRAHGLDGSFYVEDVAEPLEHGAEVAVAGRSARVERRAGTEARPIVRLSGVHDRSAAEALRGERILVAGGALAEGEYLSADLVGCIVPGVGEVRRVVQGPSCDVLEVGADGVLIPFVSDAIKRVDLQAGVIEVDTGFLGLDERSSELP